MAVDFRPRVHRNISFVKRARQLEAGAELPKHSRSSPSRKEENRNRVLLSRDFGLLATNRFFVLRELDAIGLWPQ